MCLIYVAHRVDPRYPLVVAANRDEFHQRPAAPAAWWDEASGVLAGRDLEAGGTWLGMSRGGRFAAITNFRDPAHQVAGARSRGFLVSGFLRSRQPALAFLREVAGDGTRYNGFSLLVHDGERLAFYSNRDGEPETVAPGIHGLSNHLLDTPWPKVEEGKLDLLSVLAGGAPTPAGLLGLLDRRAPDGESGLADAGAVIESERWRSSRFILDSRYGTRCSTIILVSGDGEVLFRERSFDAAGEVRGDAVHTYSVERR